MNTLPSSADILKRLRAKLHTAMRADRVGLLREMGKLQGMRKPEEIAQGIARLEKKLAAAAAKKERRRNSLPRVSIPEALPIAARRADIVDAIRKNPVVIITGETGSGKTTQIPKMCLEAGRGVDGKIGCTQPRRVAAITVSQRIAEEMGEDPGRSVGYKIRFEDRTSADVFIKIMTDGILLMEAQADPFLNGYDTIIVDEAHERSLNIDFVLGMLKNLLRKRRDLKVVITSATIDTEKFSAAFGGAPILEVSGRMYPVDIRYEPLDEGMEEREEITHVEAAVRAVDGIIDAGEGGDILVFMPTEQDIRESCDLLEGREHRGVKILPMYARLSSQDQRRVFFPMRERKIVVATNVAETSITIPGIRFVIDTGLARISYYNPRTRTSSLPVRPVSRSSADQRAGRCGRVEHGVCIRLYSREDYENRALYTAPEILRSNLAEVILRMLTLRIDDPAAFPFVDPPAPKSFRAGYDILEELGAIERENGEDGAARYRLTARGRRMARLPLDPRISRMILEAETEGCLGEILVIAAALSTQDPRERPSGKEKEADGAQALFVNPSSDFLTLINIWERFHENGPSAKSPGRLRKYCRDHFLSFRRMREWRDVHGQIREIVEEQAPPPGEKHPAKKQAGDPQAWYGRIHRSVLSGYLSNIAVKKEKNTYGATGGRQVVIFPGSGLYNRGGDWIVAAEIVETTQLFARTAANIDREWLEALGGSLCRSIYLNPRWDRKRGEVTALERVSLYGLVIVEGRRVSYGRIDPQEATQIFIREALVPAEMERPLPFLAHNRDLIERVRDMENRLRRRTFLTTDDVLAAFYEERLQDIYDVRTLQRMVRDRGSDSFLRMTEEDVLRQAPDPAELSLYPDTVAAGRLALPLSYRFRPGRNRRRGYPEASGERAHAPAARGRRVGRPGSSAGTGHGTRQGPAPGHPQAPHSHPAVGGNDPAGDEARRRVSARCPLGVPEAQVLAGRPPRGMGPGGAARSPEAPLRRRGPEGQRTPLDARPRIPEKRPSRRGGIPGLQPGQGGLGTDRDRPLGVSRSARGDPRGNPAGCAKRPRGRRLPGPRPRRRGRRPSAHDKPQGGRQRPPGRRKDAPDPSFPERSGTRPPLPCPPGRDEGLVRLFRRDEGAGGGPLPGSCPPPPGKGHPDPAGLRSVYPPPGADASQGAPGASRGSGVRSSRLPRDSPGPGGARGGKPLEPNGSQFPRRDARRASAAPAPDIS